MARMPVGRRSAESVDLAWCVPVTDSADDQAQAVVTREGRMARFVAGFRFGRLLAVGALVAVGWLLGLVHGFAAPASADSHTPAGRTVTVAVAAVKAVDGGRPGKVLSGKVPRRAGAARAAGTAGAAKVPRRAEVVKAVKPREGRRSASRSSHDPTGPAVAGGFPTVGEGFPADAGAMAGRSVDGLTSQSKPAPSAPSAADHSAGGNGFVPRGGSSPFGPGLGDLARSGFDPRLMVAPAPAATAPAPSVRTAADDPSYSPD